MNTEAFVNTQRSCKLFLKDFSVLWLDWDAWETEEPAAPPPEVVNRCGAVLTVGFMTELHKTNEEKDMTVVRLEKAVASLSTAADACRQVLEHDAVKGFFDMVQVLAPTVDDTLVPAMVKEKFFDMVAAAEKLHDQLTPTLSGPIVSTLLAEVRKEPITRLRARQLFEMLASEEVCTFCPLAEAFQSAIDAIASARGSTVLALDKACSRDELKLQDVRVAKISQTREKAFEVALQIFAMTSMWKKLALHESRVSLCQAVLKISDKGPPVLCEELKTLLTQAVNGRAAVRRPSCEPAEA